jgi:competence protein ComEA
VSTQLNTALLHSLGLVHNPPRIRIRRPRRGSRRTYGRPMRTELPAARLHRRLGGSGVDADDPSAEGAAVGDSEGDVGDDPKALLPRWLPDGAVPGGARGWLAAVRADPGRAGAVALAVVAALAVLVTVFTLVRDDPAPVVSAKLPPVEMVSSASPRTSGNPAPVPNQPVVVSVVGLVTNPGLVTLAPEARVADAVSAAGGALGGADTIGLNMARHLADGEQVVVGLAPAPGEPAALGSSVTSADAKTSPPGAPGAPAGQGTTPGQPIDLNAATVEQLDALPGVGPVTAAAIVAWRAAHGSFASVEQLGDVDGIGPARLDKLRDLVHA